MSTGPTPRTTTEVSRGQVTPPQPREVSHVADSEPRTPLPAACSCADRSSCAPLAASSSPAGHPGQRSHACLISLRRYAICGLKKEEEQHDA